MTVGMSLVHWQKVRLSAGPVLVKVSPSLLLTWLGHWLQCHGFLCGPLPSALCLVQSLRILWLESSRGD